MAEYIESICRRCFHAYVCEQFNEHRDSSNEKCHFFNDHFVPAADVAPVRHGRWELEYETYGKLRCSVCKKEALLEKATGDVGVITLYVDSNYCPNCGAHMKDGE